MKICILGASGMLGHTLLYELMEQGYDVRGTVRSIAAVKGIMPKKCLNLLIEGIDAYEFETIDFALKKTHPDVVINCIGLIKQLPEGKNKLSCIEINAAFPNRLLILCRDIGCRLIHYSTDCVFDGHKGSPYTEEDPCTAQDIYGITKYLGELHEWPALTIRTSIIGPELRNKVSLIEWFLGSDASVSGYTHAIYTGLPTTEHARVLTEFVLPRHDLSGIYQVASNPISKYDLLCLVAKTYEKKIRILPSDSLHDDKRLSGEKFFQATGYLPPNWIDLVKVMHDRHK